MSNTIYNVVVSIINEVTGIDPESISLDSHIVDDLQIDSFAATEILGRFEEEFNITINATDFVGVYIISDIVDTLVELGATFDDGNIESYADTSDTAYLATEHDIFSNGSKRVLTYKNMLDLMYDQPKYFKASSSISSIAPYSTESFLSYGSATSAYSTNVDSFTIKTAANNYKNFNTGLTHFASSATMTITMSIIIHYAHSIAGLSDDGDETNYNVSPASLDFDNEGTQTSSVEDTGVAYTDNTMANTPNLMSAGNNTRALDTLGCNSNEYNTSCTALTSATCDMDAVAVCGYKDTFGNCGMTPTFSVNPGVCLTTVSCYAETDGCACADDGDSRSCVTVPPVTYYYISYKATVYPIGSTTEIATVTATFATTDIFNGVNLKTTYLSIPTKKYFNKTSTNTTNPFGFRIEIAADTDYTGTYFGYTIANSTITYNRPTYYVFNPNNKTVRYATANNLYTNYTQS